MSIRLFKASWVFVGLLGLTNTVCSAQTVIRVAPPAPKSVVVVGRAPGPKYVWIGGYWTWRSGHYVWVAGRWIVPPRAGVVWGRAALRSEQRRLRIRGG